MESLENYNIILVHGAADSKSGIDCENNSTEVLEAYDYGRDSVNHLINRMNDIDGDDAVGMMKEFYPWLSNTIFGKDTLSIYLQRPFTNPANSPLNNAHELGNPNWKGKNKCSTRRSLIEEAQEVRANGRDSLKEFRNSKQYDKLPPSRNILIAHSMGGVASREYVQGEFYNGDVDKVITLDSPHEGSFILDYEVLYEKDIYSFSFCVYIWL